MRNCTPPPHGSEHALHSGHSATSQSIGSGVGASVGDVVGAAVGAGVGAAVGAAVGTSVGAIVGEVVGAKVGVAVGASVGTGVGAGVGQACVLQTRSVDFGHSFPPWAADTLITTWRSCVPVPQDCVQLVQFISLNSQCTAQGTSLLQLRSSSRPGHAWPL
jgi:hypothetical protein